MSRTWPWPKRVLVEQGPNPPRTPEQADELAAWLAVQQRGVGHLCDDAMLVEGALDAVAVRQALGLFTSVADLDRINGTVDSLTAEALTAGAYGLGALAALDLWGQAGMQLYEQAGRHTCAYDAAIVIAAVLGPPAGTMRA